MSGIRSKFFADGASPAVSPTKRLATIQWDDESDNDDQDTSETSEFDFAAEPTFSPVKKTTGKRERITNDNDDDSDDDSSYSEEHVHSGIRQALSPIKPTSAYQQYFARSTNLNDHARAQITAESLEARVIGLVSDRLVAENQTSFNKVIAFISHFFSDDDNFRATIHAYEAKKALLGRAVSALCASFVVVHNHVTDEEFILVGLSSPVVNQDLQNRLQQVAESSEMADSFKLQAVVSEPASNEYQKLIKAVTHHLGVQPAGDPGKPCAEKAYFSSLIKLQQEQGSDLSVKMICNVRFLPQEVTEQNEAQPSDLAFHIGLKKFKMAIIPPCPDCKKNMAATALVMSAAKFGNQVLSPIKKNSTKRVLTAGRIFDPHFSSPDETPSVSSRVTPI